MEDRGVINKGDTEKNSLSAECFFYPKINPDYSISCIRLLLVRMEKRACALYKCYVSKEFGV